MLVICRIECVQLLHWRLHNNRLHSLIATLCEGDRTAELYENSSVELSYTHPVQPPPHYWLAVFPFVWDLAATQTKMHKILKMYAKLETALAKDKQNFQLQESSLHQTPVLLSNPHRNPPFTSLEALASPAGTATLAPSTCKNLFFQSTLTHTKLDRLYVDRRLVWTPNNFCAPPGTKSWRRHWTLGPQTL